MLLPAFQSIPDPICIFVAIFTPFCYEWYTISNDDDYCTSDTSLRSMMIIRQDMTGPQWIETPKTLMTQRTKIIQKDEWAWDIWTTMIEYEVNSIHGWSMDDMPICQEVYSCYMDHVSLYNGRLMTHQIAYHYLCVIAYTILHVSH